MFDLLKTRGSGIPCGPNVKNGLRESGIPDDYDFGRCELMLTSLVGPTSQYGRNEWEITHLWLELLSISFDVIQTECTSPDEGPFESLDSVVYIPSGG